MRAMRKTILLIRNAFSHDFGGAERYPVFVGKVLKSNSYHPLIISRSPKLLENAHDAGLSTVKGVWWSKQNWSGRNVLIIPLYVLWQFILFFWYLYQFIRLRPLAIHIQSKDDFIAATFAGRVLGARVIWTDHADLKHIWQGLRVWYKNPVGKLVYISAFFAHNITVISKSEYNEVTKHLSKKSSVIKKIKVINNGSPDVKDAYNVKPSDIFTFCSTNRLVGDKGIQEAIEAFKKFNVKHPSSRLVLVGNGPEEEKFKKLANDNNSIIFTGYQADPISYLASADVLLQPTYHEGFSISILEAFMMEKAVIGTAVGGNLEMIDSGRNGLLVPVRDVNALYTAMEKLYLKPGLRISMAKEGRKQYLDNYVFDKIVKERFIPLYEATD